MDEWMDQSDLFGGDFKLVRQDEVNDELRGDRGKVGLGLHEVKRGIGGSMSGINFFHALTNVDSMDCSADGLLQKARTEVLIVAAAVADNGDGGQGDDGVDARANRECEKHSVVAGRGCSDDGA
ncbi:hypothetical protein Syun_015284 [Stephania yunnanensis]|uniref:Uncharacterized protein n=1 Tax=Stephania yunnanensis TaxID=152371 RepID=A0AAP0PAF5_9MAGN